MSYRFFSEVINSICLKGADLNEFIVQPSLVDKCFDDDTMTFSEEYTWKYEYQRFLAALAYLGRFPEEEVSTIVRSSLFSGMDELSKIDGTPGPQIIDVPSGPCVPGQMRLFVNVFGQFFPCERVSESSPAMCIGSLDNGFDVNRAYQLLNVGQLTEGVCKKCWAFRYCTLCAKKADNGSDKLSAKTKLKFCRESKANAYFKIKQYLMLKELPIYYSKQIRAKEKGVSL